MNNNFTPSSNKIPQIDDEMEDGEIILTQAAIAEESGDPETRLMKDMLKKMKQHLNIKPLTL